MVEYKIGDLEAIHLYKCIRKKHIINNKMENYSAVRRVIMKYIKSIILCFIIFLSIWMLGNACHS